MKRGRMITAMAVATAVIVAITVVAVLMLTGGDEDAPGVGKQTASETTVSDSAETLTVQVVLYDTVPLELLANLDDTSCYVRSDAADVTVRNAEGALVGSETISGTGGSRVDDGCLWQVTFSDVPASDFYEAAVRAGAFERSASAAVDGVTVSIEIPV